MTLFLLNLSQMSAEVHAAENKLNSYSHIPYTDDSYRLSLDFSSPRRYATRFDKETRTLQLRIIPARSEDVQKSAFYDPRFIQRVIVKEKDSEVILNIQLKNFPMSWVVATKEEPWRIILDFWRTEEEKLS